MDAGGALGFVVIIASAMFAGGALYVSIVEQPARMAAGMAAARAQFGPSYDRAAIWQGGSAVIALAVGVAAAIVEGDWLWGASAVSTGLAVPWTLVVMLPAVRVLHDEEDLPDDEAASVFRKWELRHLVRSVLGASGLILAALAAML
jgi:hypothetical protein